MNKKEFNNKIFFLIIILSIALGLIISNRIAFLKGYEVVTCAVLFVMGMFAYHGILQLKEKKQATKDKENQNKDEIQSTDNNNAIQNNHNNLENQNKENNENKDNN